MTTYTPLGEHHMKVRKNNFNPTTRGNDHAKGKSYCWIFCKNERNRTYSRKLAYLENLVKHRLQRKRDKVENIRSKEEDFLADLNYLNQEYGLQ